MAPLSNEEFENPQSAERLTDFYLRLTTFLGRLSERLWDAEDQRAFRGVLFELDRFHMLPLREELRQLESCSELARRGLAGRQLEFKLGLANRSIDCATVALEEPGSSEWRELSGDALGQAKIVLASLTEISREVDGLLSIVELTEQALAGPGERA